MTMALHINKKEEKHGNFIEFICLAASDNETHLRALSSLTKILSKKESLHRLVAAETVPEILSIIQEGEK